MSSLSDELKLLFLVSELKILPLTSETEGERFEVPGVGTVVVQASVSPHPKCARCWHHAVDVGHSAEHPELCDRCVQNVYGEGEDREWF